MSGADGESDEAVFAQLQHHGDLFFDTGSSGPEDIFEEDSYSPSSYSSSASTVSPVKSVCTSCNKDILDRYLLKVNDLCWHVRCLSCTVCKTSLGRHVSCYIKEKQVFCKLDYFRRYGTRCTRCGRNINSSDWVRRVRGSTFHLACFSCSSCKRQLSTGEECGLLENRVFCRPHFEMVVENIKRAKKNEESNDGEDMGDKEEASTTARPAKRARTSFTVDQLQVITFTWGFIYLVESISCLVGCKSWLEFNHQGMDLTSSDGQVQSMKPGFASYQGETAFTKVMQTQFAKDSNPDAQTLQRLSDRTGLSRRVIQVWFQNCRARQKKHICPNPASNSVMTSLAPSPLTPPIMEDLQYATYISPDGPLLTTLTYMDVQNPDPLLVQPLVSYPLTQLNLS